MGVVSASGQTTVAPEPLQSEETIVLSPFQVQGSSDVGYQATETLSGSRLRTDLKDVATQVTVMTAEFLQDLAITDLDDAMLYSLNSENRSEVVDVGAPGGLGIAETTNALGAGGGRSRGLGASNRAHDFFDTIASLDSYNTERFTFSSGPNAILFGNSSASGTIDTSLKRAQLRRQRYETSFRFDDRGSHRITLDLNQPIIRDRIGIRVAALKERNKDWRKPAFKDQDRIFLSVVATPFKMLTARAYFETGSFYAEPSRNTLIQDHVTPWIEAGRPLFNNGGGLAAPFPAVPAIFARLNTTNPKPYYVFDANGLLTPVGQMANTVITRGYDLITPAPNNFERSVIDPSIYPRDLNFSGNGNRSKMNTWMRGLILEANPIANLYVEAGVNWEEGKHRGVDFFNNQAAELNVDVNQYLNDRATPNPYAGWYFFDDDTSGTILRKNYQEKLEKRLSVSYELDFEKRAGWKQWLGRHRVAVLLDDLESISLSQPTSFDVVGDYPFLGTGTAARDITFRYYFNPNDPKARRTVAMPFDPLADGLVTLPGSNVTIASWHPDVPTAASFTNNRQLVDSRVLALQSFLLKGRLVVTYGERRDDVDLQQTPSLGPTSDFESRIDGNLPWETQKADKPVTRMKSVVAHPLSWLSFSYAESDSQVVGSQTRRNLDGAIAVLDAGSGKEYGITMRWGQRLSLRVSKYENARVGATASALFTTPVATVGGRGNVIKRELANIERTAQIAESIAKGDPTGATFQRSAKYAAYQDYLLETIPNGQNAGNVIQNVFDLISDRDAKGYEATLVGNPTRNWRISVSAAKNQTAESNIGLQYFDFIQERLPTWSQYLSTPFRPNAGGATLGQVLQASIGGFNFVRLADGRMNTLERKYRLTATTRYSFDRGPLKGGYAGANYLWRSPSAVGYTKTTITDNPFVVPGLTSNAVEVDNIDDPILGPSITSIDAFIGYGRKLSRNGRVNWRVQLNIRNVLNRDGLLMQRALSNGSGAIYTAQEPRSFILTNTFSF